MATLSEIPRAEHGDQVGAGRPLIMGILNVTPDSFSDGGRHPDAQSAVDFGLRLMDEGADLLDIGGESTRPGSRGVSPSEQWRRIGTVVAELSRRGTRLSVDTRSAEVARRALDAGASIINDVSAGEQDPDMFRVAADHRAELILMHMQGRPETMQASPHYEDCLQEVKRYLEDRAGIACDRGVDPERIWIDPGIGFGKQLAHNLDLLRGLPELTRTGYKVLLGASRKSFICQLFGADTGSRLGGSLAALEPARRAGVYAVRVHDVRATYQYLELLSRLD